MSDRMVQFVGGPANGDRGLLNEMSHTVRVPVLASNSPTLGNFIYTLRKCWRENGSEVFVMAPAGRPIDPQWLSHNKLRN